MAFAVQSGAMPIGTPIVPWKCRQCKYEWISRTKGKPKRCPKPKGCGSSLWDRGPEKRGPKPAKKRKK